MTPDARIARALTDRLRILKDQPISETARTALGIAETLLGQASCTAQEDLDPVLVAVGAAVVAAELETVAHLDFMSAQTRLYSLDTRIQAIMGGLASGGIPSDPRLTQALQTICEKLTTLRLLPVPALIRLDCEEGMGALEKAVSALERMVVLVCALATHP